MTPENPAPRFYLIPTSSLPPPGGDDGWQEISDREKLQEKNIAKKRALDKMTFKDPTKTYAIVSGHLCVCRRRSRSTKLKRINASKQGLR